MKGLLLGTIIGLMAFSTLSSGFAQISIGEPAIQTVTIKIDENNAVHVTHEVKKSSGTQQIDLVTGTVSNLQVVDIEGNDIQHAKSGAGDIVGISIFPTSKNALIEYDLDDVLLLKDGVWTWNFLYLHEVVFLFPEKIDLIFTNERPVYLGQLESEGIRCHGCQMVLEFINDEPISYQEVSWEDKNFQVELRTKADISSFNFDQPLKTISFDVYDANQFITLKIPLELLWSPYEVFLDDEKILRHQNFINEGFVNLNIRPENAGTIQIIGVSAIPEFPLFAPLFIGILMAIIFPFRNKINLR